MTVEEFRAILAHRYEHLEAELTTFVTRQPDEEIYGYAANIAHAAVEADRRGDAKEMVLNRLALYALLTLLRQLEEDDCSEEPDEGAAR